MQYRQFWFFFTSISAVSAIIILWTSVQSELLVNPFFALLSILGAVDRTRGRQKARLEHSESYLIIGLSNTPVQHPVKTPL
jgi:hypothetical protein